jgi:hypothetical protein
MTNKGGIVVSVPLRSSTTRSGFGATSVDTEASSDGAGGPCRFCGAELRHTFVTVDRNPYKQGRFLPGTHIPIHSPEKIAEVEPDVIRILPWSFKDEIIEQLAHARAWGAEFVVPIPEVTVY